MASSASAPLRSVSLTAGPTRSVRLKTPKVIACSRDSSDVPVPDFLSSNWLELRKKKPFGPRLNFNAEEAVLCQLDALKYNDQPRQDYGIEFAGFDPFERSSYFGPHFDLGQFERFRRIFHHSTYRVLLSHKERKILSSLWVKESMDGYRMRQVTDIAKLAIKFELREQNMTPMFIHKSQVTSEGYSFLI